MTDTVTQKPIQVNVTPTGTVWLKLPYVQVSDVRQLLDSHQARYWVEEEVMSVNGGPYMAWINFLTGTDVTTIQKILDSVS